MSPQGGGAGSGGGGGKLMPNLDQSSTKVLNLTVLQRIDPFVEEILITVAHVTLYEFNIHLNQWSRKDVEGSLFVVKRNTQPRFQFIVMNRRNTENLIEDLLGDFEYEVQVPYLLYRNAAQEVNGVWFYNGLECEAVANLFSRILSAFSKVPPKNNISPSKREFVELEAKPSLSVIQGPLEPSTSASTVTEVPDDSFVNFFSAAMNVSGTTNPLISGQPQLSSAPNPMPLSSHGPIAVTSSAPTPKPSLPSSSTPLASIFDSSESSSTSTVSHTTNLVTPYFFVPPSSGLVTPLVVTSSSAVPLVVTSSSAVPLVVTSSSAVPLLHPPINLQRPYGAPLLQPFPPPTPPPSLTPTNYGPVVKRDKVRDALLRLVQNNQFIDMVYGEMLNSHSS